MHNFYKFLCFNRPCSCKRNQLVTFVICAGFSHTDKQRGEFSLANIWNNVLVLNNVFHSSSENQEDNLPFLQKTSSLAISPDNCFFTIWKILEPYCIHPINTCCIVCKGGAQGPEFSVWKTLFPLRGPQRRISMRTKLCLSGVMASDAFITSISLRTTN